MKVVSVNRGEAQVVKWQGKDVETGIFKYSVDEPIALGATDVLHDNVMDRKHHAGVDKAVYTYGLNCYAYWKEKYPELDWQLGMFGENLTIDELDEFKILVGNIYRVGDAEVQVCQPRQPCFKLGIRFNTQGVLKEFINSPYPGIYFRVLKPGKVAKGDIFQLFKEENASPTILEVYALMFHKIKDRALMEKALECEFLPEKCKKSMVKMQV